MFGTSERQTLSAVMVHHLRDAGKHTAALVQGVAVLFSLSHDDVHAALARPNSQGKRRRRRKEKGEGEGEGEGEEADNVRLLALNTD